MKGVLIGGTSHCGKSTLAEALGAAFNWPVQSTDKLARHPGRPWLGVPDAVAEFYETLSDESIYWFLRVHHTNMWPALAEDIEARAEGFVLEGSALRPEHLATLSRHDLAKTCLHADADFLAERIRVESGYAQRDTRLRKLIDKFITRSLRDNADVVQAARTHGIRLIDVSEPGALAAFKAELLAHVAP